MMKKSVPGWVLGFACAVCFAATAEACRIPVVRPWPIEPRPSVPPPAPPPVQPILTRLHTADIQVEGTVARVEVAATFFNPNRFRVEGTYFFPIEADAVVKNFAMTVNGTEQSAELLEAARAKQIYEEIVRKMRDPGLLEYVGTRMLQARVFPIEPNSEIKVRLTYHQVVRGDGGLYHFRYPLRSATPNQGKLDQLSVRVSVASDTPIKTFYSPSHKIDVSRKDDRKASGGFEQSQALPERDFDVYWSLNESDLGVSVAAYRRADEDGYCLIALAPKVEVAADPVEPKDLVFVFDKSGSMAGEKIQQARNALNYCLNRLNPKDRFSVVLFSTEVDNLTGGLNDATPEAVAAAKDQVAKAEARGGTAIHDALNEACRQIADSRRLAMIVFLTDGKPTIGATDLEEILGAAKKANTARARIFVFGVGYDLNTDLLDRLANDHKGTQEYVGEKEDIEVRVSNFYERIAQPVVSDVTVECAGAKLLDFYPRQVPDLFRGGQALLFGRYRGTGKQTVVVRGTARGKPAAFECEADFSGQERNGFLPSVWAHRKVAYLLEEIRLRGKTKELEDEVVSLGKRYGILTPYTSFLIVEDQRPERREEVAAARWLFEFAKSGRGGVDLSYGLARAKAANVAPSAGPAQLGMPSGEAAAARTWDAAHDRVRRIADKVFYLRPDGFYYDSVFDEAAARDIIDVAYLSDGYFALTGTHPGIGKYLAAGVKLVLCIEGKVYRIAGP